MKKLIQISLLSLSLISGSYAGVYYPLVQTTGYLQFGGSMGFDKGDFYFSDAYGKYEIQIYTKCQGDSCDSGASDCNFDFQKYIITTPKLTMLYPTIHYLQTNLRADVLQSPAGTTIHLNVSFNLPVGGDAVLVLYPERSKLDPNSSMCSTLDGNLYRATGNAYITKLN